MTIFSKCFCLNRKNLIWSVQTILTIHILLSQWESVQAQGDTKISFNDHIRPILSDHCVQCHGPDNKSRKAKLRLDQKDGIFGELGKDGVVIPGDVNASELFLRIVHEDPDEIMPPPEIKKPLTNQQKELLKKWIQQGAPFEEHWSFETPKRPTIPDNFSDHFHKNPIDHFTFKKLHNLGLTPNNEADKRTLIRRVYFDLTGLPPTTDEINRFLNNTSENAYEDLVNELLSSERYGERMTLAWMDAARYGDSSVFHDDGVRFMWPWRDWVIRAYNQNKPFDVFTIEQLAGDLLPNASVDQKVASGFNRNHGTTDEGGAIDEEYRVEYIVDRVKTTSNVWLGLSMECAQCHDHKYDPISQKEYYQFYAYFNISSDRGMQTRNGNSPPMVQVFTESQSDQLKGIRASIKSTEAEITAKRPGVDVVKSWAINALNAAPKERPEMGDWFQLGPFKANNLNNGFNRNFGPEKLKSIDTSKESGKKKWELKKDYKDNTAINLNLPDNSAVYLYKELKTNESSDWMISLGSDDAIKVFLNGKEVFKKNISRGVAPNQDKATLKLTKGTNHLILKIANGGGDAGFFFDLRESEFPNDILAILKKKSDQWEKSESDKISQYYADNLWIEGKDLKAQLAKLKGNEKSVLDSVVTSMTMGDQPKPRMTYILDRGHYASPIKDEAIQPNVPEFLPTLEKESLKNRLGLANWIVDPSHPLTARVTVNRYWMMFFGEGLVSTEADFGTRGATPSNQALLDWLAVEFVESGWNVKHIIRLMLTSGTYRQSSRFTDKNLALDPQNRFLSRGSRFRLQGEFIRDNALALSGLLNDKIGGPSVKPYQPPRIWNEVSLNGGLFYKRDNGEKLYRRTMYTYWKRSAPNPSMVTFDAPTREKCVIQRQRTNTPLQALVTMNDITFVETARVWAQNLITQNQEADFDDRLDQAFLESTAKPADPIRKRLLKALYQSQLTHFKQNPELAKELAQSGEYNSPNSVDASELAAWTMVTSAILNLDEVLTRE